MIDDTTMDRNEFEPLWTVKEVADYLRLKPNTVRNKVYANQIPSMKVAGSVRFRPSEIEAWIRAQNTPRETQDAA